MLLIFQLSGNVAVSYFYLIASVVVVFVSFLIFSRTFMRTKSWLTAIVVSTLFTLNPAFLGNLAKVGLVMAAALLPLCLVLLNKFFAKKQFKYLLLYVFLLNISLIHPYTFTVNLLISGAYFAYHAWREREWIAASWLKFVGIGGVALAMSLYFLLPIASLGSISKDILSQDISDTPVDYTTLVDIANTSGLSNAFGLSKQVFLDFSFTNDVYKPIFLIGVFGVYVIMVGLYVHLEKRLRPSDRRLFIGCLAVTLLLILLSTGTLFNIDAVIKFLISQPGGWMFRSPLKWQLYIPFFLCTGLLILLRYLPKSWLRRGAQGALALVILLMNGYLLGSVYTRILVPRTVGEFAALQNMPLDDKSVLFANTETCTFYAQDNPGVFTEMNQILASKNVQVKRILADNIGSIGLSSYNYILSCEQSAKNELQKRTDFAKVASFAGGSIELYQNQASKPAAYATTELFALSAFQNVGAKQSLVATELQKDFHFIDEDDGHASTGLYDAFDNVSPSTLKAGSVVTSVIPNNNGTQKLMLHDKNRVVYYQKQNNQILLSPTPDKNFSRLPASLDFDASAGKSLEFRYTDKAYNYQNIMPNPSLEDGLWQDKVVDCNAYDTSALIGMKVDKKDKTDGRQSLRLEAQRHIACTGPNDIVVKPGSHYLLSFDYRSSIPKKAGYYIGFNNADEDFVSDRLPGEHDDWQQYSQVISIPQGTTQLKMLLYAYPDDATGDNVDVHYDNFQLIEVPDLQDEFYVLSDARLNYKTPQSVTLATVDPTRKKIRVTSASTPFYLVLNESYHPKWRLDLSNDKVNSAAGSWLPLGVDAVSEADHFKVNNALNAWFVDPEQLCRDHDGCIKNGDGSYDMDLVAEFAPQRSFYVGAIVSSVAWLGVAGYLGFDSIKTAVQYVRRRHEH